MKDRWQRPITTRRYLNPPRSERLHTLWLEGKLVFGEIYAPSGTEVYKNYISSGISFVLDKADGQLDFRRAKSKIRDDGIPIHTVVCEKDGLSVSIEAFSSYKRIPECFIRLTARNISDRVAKRKLGFVLRTAPEYKLVRNSPDIYRSYSSEIGDWFALSPSFVPHGEIYRDGDKFLSISSPVSFDYDPEYGVSMAEISLVPSGDFTCDFVFSEESAVCKSYDTAKSEVISAWQKELSALKLPDALKKDKETERMCTHLVSTVLQCFNYAKGTDILLARQGGLSRMVWPFESVPVLSALCRLGDFDSYIEPIIHSYFYDMQSEEGEIVPFGIHWAMCTANALLSFSDYAKKRGEEYFRKYSDKAYSAFLWIKKTRASTVEEGNIIGGIFPPKRSCDDVLVFQSFANTDSFNLCGLAALKDAFAQFGDARAEEISEEYGDYLSVMQKIWKDIVKRGEGDEIRIPYTPLSDDQKVAESFVFGHFGAYLVESVDPPAEDVERVINYYTRRGFMKGGLYDRMPDKSISGSTVENLDENGKCIVWYMTVHEYFWFLYFMRHGMRDRAKEIIDDAISYAMTDEYYMLERYKETDPYFVPWSPNASANGRLLNMLLDYYAN